MGGSEGTSPVRFGSVSPFFIATWYAAGLVKHLIKPLGRHIYSAEFYQCRFELITYFGAEKYKKADNTKLPSIEYVTLYTILWASGLERKIKEKKEKHKNSDHDKGLLLVFLKWILWISN